MKLGPQKSGLTSCAKHEQFFPSDESCPWCPAPRSWIPDNWVTKAEVEAAAKAAFGASSRYEENWSGVAFWGYIFDGPMLAIVDTADEMQAIRRKMLEHLKPHKRTP
jgi:hypothetical protein